ncbi:hypothetical protein ACFV1L_36030 [Kitasatospora sp. NPDC059646]|uniref:hypothetical protein n=1 Tax=Kitasatospora sp. NPDC059646 TaxID=3346893 RepID=UPI003695C497
MPLKSTVLVAALTGPVLATVTAFAPHQDVPTPSHRAAATSGNARYDALSTEPGDRDAGPHVKCLLDQGPCGPDATELKQGLPEALEGPCRDCSAEQAKGTAVVAHLTHNRPGTWADLQGKYAPDRSFEDKAAAENGFAEDG